MEGAAGKRIAMHRAQIFRGSGNHSAPAAGRLSSRTNLPDRAPIKGRCNHHRDARLYGIQTRVSRKHGRARRPIFALSRSGGAKTLLRQQRRERRRPAHQLSRRQILIPVDFSAFSAVALDLGLALARDLGAKVSLFHVVKTPLYPLGDQYAALPAGRFVEKQHERRRAMQAMAAKAKAEF